MTEISRTRNLEAGVDEVWAALADFGAIARWAPNVDHSCLLSERVEGIGAVRRIQAGRSTLLERVTEWEQGAILAYTIEGLPPVVRSVVNRWAVEPDGGGTRVVLTSRVESGSRPPQRLVARAIGRRLGAASDQMLDGLERHLTGRSPTP